VSALNKGIAHAFVGKVPLTIRRKGLRILVTGGGVRGESPRGPPH